MTVTRPDRIALTITIATPIAMRTSPMLKTFANGSHVGSEYASVNGSRAGLATIEELVYPAFRPPPSGREGGLARGHEPAVGHDRREVGSGSDRDEGHAGDPDVADHGDEDRARRRDVERRTQVAHDRAHRFGEQDELDQEPADGQPRPVEVDRREAAQPSAQHEAEDQADQNGVQDEHVRVRSLDGGRDRAVRLPGRRARPSCSGRA